MATFTNNFCIDRLNLSMADYLDIDINQAKGKCILKIIEDKYGQENVHFKLISRIKDEKDYVASNVRLGNYLISTSPLYDADNNFTGFVYLARDISRIIQTEQALRNSEQRYRMLVENAFDGIYLLKNNKFQYVNSSFCTITGFTSDELLGRDFSIYNLLTDESIEITEQRLQMRLENLNVSNPYSMPLKRKDGSIFHAEISTVAVNSEDRLNVLGIVRDITERKNLEDKMLNLNKELEQRVEERTSQLRSTMIDLQNEIVIRKQTEDKLVQAKNEITGAFQREKELNDLKTRFIEMISHEYRTPLTVILSSTYLIERYTENIENQDLLNSVNRIRKAVKAMTDLLENVVLVGKFQEQNPNLNLVDVNLANIAEQVRNDVVLLDKDTHIIEFHIEDKHEFSKSEPAMLRLIMLNLLTNALKFTKAGNKITFSLRSTSTQYMIIIKDEGIGIPEDEIDKVFEPFYRAKNVGAIQGIGLGLSIVKGCVDALGAQMTISSSLDKGTGVMVSFPKN
jgi:PAS domain S-box-containing protein